MSAYVVQMQTFDMISIPLKATVMCQAINPTEDKLVLGCCDCSVVSAFLSIANSPTHSTLLCTT